MPHRTQIREKDFQIALLSREASLFEAGINSCEYPAACCVFHGFHHPCAWPLNFVSLPIIRSRSQWYESQRACTLAPRLGTLPGAKRLMRKRARIEVCWYDGPTAQHVAFVLPNRMIILWTPDAMLSLHWPESDKAVTRCHERKKKGPKKQSARKLDASRASQVVRRETRCKSPHGWHLRSQKTSQTWQFSAAVKGYSFGGSRTCHESQPSHTVAKATQWPFRHCRNDSNVVETSAV